LPRLNFKRLDDLPVAQPKVSRSNNNNRHRCHISIQNIIITSEVLLALLYHCWVNAWLIAPCGLRGCKNWPTPFHGQMSYKATKSGLVSVLYLNMRYTVLLFIRAPIYVLLVFVTMCSVFWLFWLSYQYLPSDWLKRLLWGSLIVARGSFPESPGRRVRMIFLVYCIASLFCYVFVLSPAPSWYIILLLWRDIAYLCWKCR